MVATPKGVYLPILKPYSILVVANFHMITYGYVIMGK